MTSEQLPLQGPEKGECECGDIRCFQYGRLGKPRNGRRHVRGCPCLSCTGRRSRARGKKKQRDARKALGIPGLSMGTDEEELWRGAVRVEVKSGAADTKPIDTRYRKMRAQSDAARAIGDHRPFGAVAMPPGMSDGYVIVRLSEVGDFARAVVAQADGQE